MKFYIVAVIVISLMVVGSALELEINRDNNIKRIVNLDKVLEAVRNFLDLDDTPTTYSGANSFCVTVNSAGTGIIFTNCSVAGGDGNTQKTTNGFFLFNDTTTIFFNGTQLNDTIKQLDTNISNTEKTTNGFFLFNNSNTIFFNGTQLNQTIVQLDTNITNSEKTTNGTFLFNDSTTIFFNATQAIFHYNFSQVGESVFWYNFSNVGENVFWYNFSQIGESIFWYNFSDASVDFTNVAFLNNTQTFTEPNRFTDEVNITELNNLSMGSCTINWNGSCLNTMCDGDLVMSVGCI